jgi:hypothetical protein
MNDVLRKENRFINRPNYLRKEYYGLPQTNLIRNLEYVQYILHFNLLIHLLNSIVNSGGDHASLCRH